MIKYYISYILAILFTAISQLLLKIGAKKSIDKNFILLYFNPYTITGYILLLISTLLSLYAFKEIPLKITIAFLPFLYIMVGIFSYIFLKESLTKKQVIGCIIIVIGIIIFNIKII